MSETAADDELRAEYQFDYTQAKPNRFAAAAKKRLVSRTPSDPALDGAGARMTTDDNIRKLRDAANAFAHNRQAGEHRVNQYDPVLQQLRKAKMLPEEYVVIGPVIHTMSDDNTQSAVYYAAGISGDGIGAFRYSLGFGDEPDALTHYKFVPYSECPPVVQAGLAGQIEALVHRLMGDLGVPAA